MRKNSLTTFLVLSLLSSLLLTLPPPSSGKATSSGLYSSEDRVLILDQSTIRQHVYHSNKTTLVEFYSSWCGHCVQFAPLWKSFASELWSWRSVLTLGVIDCADETNIPTCREYEIMGYPSFLFFPPHSSPSVKDKEGKDALNRGQTFSRPELMGPFKRDLIDLLTPLYPVLLGLFDGSPLGLNGNGIALKDFQQNSPIWAQDQASLIIVIFEGSSSYIGREVILQLSGFKKLRVLRFDKLHPLFDELELQGWPAAGYIHKSGGVGKIDLLNNHNLVDAIYKSGLEVGKINPEIDFIENNQIAPIIPANEEEPTLDGHGGEANLVPKLQADVVYMEDLIHALRNSIKNEVLMTKKISGPKLIALREYIDLLVEFFPADRREMKMFLTKLGEWIRSQSEIKATDLAEQIQYLEQDLHPFDIDASNWVGCKGSKPGYRGYPCGLWRLFHTLSVVALEREREFNIIQVIYGFVKEYFGCRDCANHFMEMVEADNALEGLSNRDQVLWLWRAHNKVNARTKGSLSEDPLHPKEPYPLKKHCPQCQRLSDGGGDPQFEESSVLSYLEKIYSNPSRAGPSYQVSHTSPHQLFDSENRVDHKLSSSGSFFSGLDIGILLFVYLSIALLLFLGYIHFRVRARRHLDPTIALMRMCSKSHV